LETAPSSGTAPAADLPAGPRAIDARPPLSVAEAPAAAEDESPININRTGHLPSLETIETALEPPSLIGSYSSAGANYKIFADGSIEAETSEGTFKFSSMEDFKRHLLKTKGNREIGA
jgi:hypothetical protein